MRKTVLFLLVIGILSISLFSLEYGENPTNRSSDSYWEAVENNDIKMTDEEYIENYTKILPIYGIISFSAPNQFDGVYYGGFSLDFNQRNQRWNEAGGPVMSEKNIKDGLYANKYPMVKTKSGRKDIEYFWHPAANCSRCVFYKFSIDNFTSGWISIIGIPKSAPKKSVWNDESSSFTKYIETNLNNPDANTFKIEGIRVIYNCDYNVIIDHLHEAYRFVNGDKKSAPTLVEAGAKVMDLSDSVFDNLWYKFWKDGKEEILSISREDTGSYIHVSSYDKLNFEDKVSAALRDNEEKVKHANELEEKLCEAYVNIETYLKAKDRTSLETLEKEINESDLNDSDRRRLISKCQHLLDQYDRLYQMWYPSKKQKLKNYFDKLKS